MKGISRIVVLDLVSVLEASVALRWREDWWGRREAVEAAAAGENGETPLGNGKEAAVSKRPISDTSPPAPGGDSMDR